MKNRHLFFFAIGCFQLDQYVYVLYCRPMYITNYMISVGLAYLNIRTLHLFWGNWWWAHCMWARLECNDSLLTEVSFVMCMGSLVFVVVVVLPKWYIVTSLFFIHRHFLFFLSDYELLFRTNTLSSDVRQCGYPLLDNLSILHETQGISIIMVLAAWFTLGTRPQCRGHSHYSQGPIDITETKTPCFCALHFVTCHSESDFRWTHLCSLYQQFLSYCIYTVGVVLLWLIFTGWPIVFLEPHNLEIF